MKDKKFIFFIVVMLLLFVLVGIFQPQAINWDQTFKHEDKIPFGTYILKEEIQSLFPGESVELSEKTIFETLQPAHENSNYFCITSNMAIDDLDVEVLLDYVASGNNAFIASNWVHPKLLDTLGLSIKVSFDHAAFTKSGDYEGKINFVSTAFESDSPYVFPLQYLNYGTYLTWENKEVYSISEDEFRRVNFAKIPLGQGFFFIHTTPEYFSNYYLSQGNTHEYVARCLSYLPQKKLIWDGYYGKGLIHEAQTPMRYILSNTSLKAAWFLLLILGAAYMLFESKRKQRAIPVVIPPVNSSLLFTKTIGNLYFHQKDHHDIAQKKINFLLEYIRSKYYLKTDQLNTEFEKNLIAKTGLAQEDIAPLMKMIKLILKSSKISETQLIQLNKQIESFYKKTK